MSFPRSASILAASALLVLGLPGRAAAQAADTTVHPLKGSIDLGLVAASGNTDLTTFNFGEKLEYQQGKWGVLQLAKMVYGQTDQVESANEYLVFVQPSYALSERWKGYVLGSWDRNTFIGISQRWQEGLGLSFAAVHGPKHFLDLDGGFSFFQQDFTNGTNTSFPTARGQVDLQVRLHGQGLRAEHLHLSAEPRGQPRLPDQRRTVAGGSGGRAPVPEGLVSPPVPERPAARLRDDGQPVHHRTPAHLLSGQPRP